MNKYLIFLFSLALSFGGLAQSILGAWKAENEIIILADGYFSIASFEANDKSFEGTRGGRCEVQDSLVSFSYEFNTWDAEMVGKTETYSFTNEDEELQIGDRTYTRLDDGRPGELLGAWIITGRMRDGEMRERKIGPRKTMKILSGTRFQWIAYNTETQAFMGTGGGTYRTSEGTYTENIDFFSRDSSRVGASLSFQFELTGGQWHHRGKSSKGNDIYEIWSLRN